MKDNQEIKAPEREGGGMHGDRKPYKKNTNYLPYVIVAVAVILLIFIILK